jgi:hypothetical protein
VVLQELPQPLTPIAGVLFAIEVLFVDVSIAAFTPIMIAATSFGFCNSLDEEIYCRSNSNKVLIS